MLDRPYAKTTPQPAPQPGPQPTRTVPVLKPSPRPQKTARRLAAAILSHPLMWWLRWLAAIAGLAGLVYLALPLALGPRLDVTPVVRAEFIQTVVASGHVEAPFRVTIGSQVTGVVAQVPVAEGQTVKAGDPLVVLDDREMQASVTQAEGAVAQAEARMRQLRELTLPAAEEALKQAQATLENAKKAYDRTATLAGNGHATKAALDDATKALDIARAQLRSAEFQVFTNRPGGSDYVMAETLLNQSRANLALARSRLSYTVIAAPRDGVLISRSVERGNVVQPSVTLMVLSPFVDTQIVVLIDEKNLGSIAAGQQALVSADAYPNDKFKAEVVYINPGVDLQRASVQVKLRVPDPPAFLRQDMTVSVDIETAAHPAALIVPTAALRGLGSATPWVMAVRGTRSERRPVTVGLSSSNLTEILSGLAEGDLVLSANAAISPGARLRPRLAKGV